MIGAGTGRQRVSRASLSNSENAGPSLALAPSGPGGVLSDVTNTTSQSGSANGQHKSAPNGGGVPCTKPPHLQQQHQHQQEQQPPQQPPPQQQQYQRQQSVAQGAVQDLASSTTSASSPEVDVDMVHAENPQYAAEYLVDIFTTLQKSENEHLPQPGYMDKQPQVNSKMRAILVDWLVDVHKKYKLKPETLFLAVSLIDRFLEKRNTMRRQLQLVGITALLVAAKFEEMYPPQIHDFVYVTDKAYTKNEVIRMEVTMLTALECRICRPTPFNFLERFMCVNGCTDAHRDLAQYLLELTITDYKMIRYAPSHLAAAAVLLSNKLLKRRPAWPAALEKHAKMNEQVLKECAKEICGLLENAEQSQLQAIRKKYSQAKHHAVAKLCFAGSPTSSGGVSEDFQARTASGRRTSTSRRVSGVVGPTDPSPVGAEDSQTLSAPVSGLMGIASV